MPLNEHLDLYDIRLSFRTPRPVKCLSLLRLEVVQKNAALLGLFAPVLNHNARTVDDLARIALAVENACSMTC